MAPNDYKIKPVEIIAKGVTHQGADVEIGEILELDERSANSLIESKHAKAAQVVQKTTETEPPKIDTEGEQTGGQVQTHSGDPANETDGKETGTPEQIDGQLPGTSGDLDNKTDGQENDAEAQAEARAKVFKALNDQYNKPDLITRAKEVGVEFPYDAKKDEIINAVIDQGKAEAVLK